MGADHEAAGHRPRVARPEGTLLHKRSAEASWLDPPPGCSRTVREKSCNGAERHLPGCMGREQSLTNDRLPLPVRALGGDTIGPSGGLWTFTMGGTVERGAG